MVRFFGFHKKIVALGVGSGGIVFLVQRGEMKRGRSSCVLVSGQTTKRASIVVVFRVSTNAYVEGQNCLHRIIVCTIAVNIKEAKSSNYVFSSQKDQNARESRAFWDVRENVQMAEYRLSFSGQFMIHTREERGC